MPPTRVLPPLHRDRADDAGFTVIEALVSFVLLAVISSASLTAIVTTITTSKGSSDRTVAANLAQQDQNGAQALRYPHYPAAIGARPIKVGSTTYTVSRTVGSACPLPPNYDSNPYMTVTTTVTWPKSGGTQHIVMAQELAC